MKYNLGEHFETFVLKEIEAGRYESATEVIISGLKLLEERNRRIQEINDLLDEGENSGHPIIFDNEKFKQEMKEKLNSHNA